MSFNESFRQTWQKSTFDSFNARMTEDRPLDTLDSARLNAFKVAADQQTQIHESLDGQDSLGVRAQYYTAEAIQRDGGPNQLQTIAFKKLGKNRSVSAPPILVTSSQSSLRRQTSNKASSSAQSEKSSEQDRPANLLFRLPAELRIRIYKIIFHDIKPNGLFHLTILRTCRVIHAEASHVLYDVYGLTIFPGINTPDATNWLEQFKRRGLLDSRWKAMFKRPDTEGLAYLESLQGFRKMRFCVSVEKKDFDEDKLRHDLKAWKIVLRTWDGWADEDVALVIAKDWDTLQGLREFNGMTAVIQELDWMFWKCVQRRQRERKRLRRDRRRKVVNAIFDVLIKMVSSCAYEG